MGKLFIGLVCTLLFFNTIQLNGENLDSLETVLKMGNLNTNKQLDLYDNLSWGYLNSNASRSKFLSKQGIGISIKNKDNKMTGVLYHHLGIALYKEGKLDSALFYFHIAESFSRKAQDNSRLNLIDIAYAVVYDTQGDYEKAIAILMKLLPALEKQKRLDLIRTVYGNLGTLYFNIHNYALSEKYFLLSEELSTKHNDDWRLSQAYNGMIDIYIIKKDFRKALEYANKTLIVAKRCGDNESCALTYQKISEIYCTYYNDFDNALKFAAKGLDVATKTCAPNDIAAMLTNLSNISYRKNDYKNCMKYALQAIQTDTIDQNVYENTVSNIVKSGIFLGNKQLTSNYFDKYCNILEARNRKQLLQLSIDSEKKYQTEKKEVQINVLKKQKKINTILFIGIIVVLLLLILVIYLRSKIIQRNKLIAEQRIEQMEKEKQLTAAQSLLEGENAERKRLARDLHDGLGGMLSIVKLNLVNMKGNAIMPEPDVSVFQNALEMLDGSIRELRRVAHNLMPESLMRYGLKPALNDFCGSVSHVHLHFFGEERRLEEKFEITIFRIVQELVNNAIKHSGASQINVQVILESDRLNLVVQDNGQGFDLSKTDTTRTSGLSSIYSRVESLGGHIDLISAPGKGTEVQIDLKI